MGSWFSVDMLTSSLDMLKDKDTDTRVFLQTENGCEKTEEVCFIWSLPTPFYILQ